MADPITTDPATPVGMVRLLTTDLDPDAALLTDEQITALLQLEGGDVRRAAAAALETIATNEALIAKKITSGDVSTDGPAVAQELRQRAQALREQAAADEDSYGITVVDLLPARRWL